MSVQHDQAENITRPLFCRARADDALDTRRGLLRREDTSSIIQSTQPIAIEKHELHSTWPIYSVPDDHELTLNQIVVRVYRKQTCYAPGDKVDIRVILTSKNVNPVKIKSVAFSVRETVTFKGSKRGSRMLGGSTKAANQKTETIAQKALSLGNKIYKGDVKTYDLSLTIPKTHSLMTIQTAKHIEVAYAIRVYVDSKKPIVIDHLPLTMTTVPRATSESIVSAIGFVPGLSAPLDSAQSLKYGEQIQRPASTGIPASAPSQRRLSVDSYSRPHQPTRSFSFLSPVPTTSSTEDSSAGLQRRDTTITTASGPGWAGRGITGALFSWSQNNADKSNSSPFGRSRSAPRPAFAGPPSIYEGRELAPEENRALFHHSYASHLGQVFEGQEPVPAVNHGHDTSARNSCAPVSKQLELPVQPERQNFSAVVPASQQPQIAHVISPALSPQDAEAEKERLYQRAREQAERNQRRAAAATTTAGKGNDCKASQRTLSSPVGGAGSVTVNEKLVLYERARREAEKYQACFDQGASFPKEDLRGAEKGAPISHYYSPANGNTAAIAAATDNISNNLPAPSPIRPTPMRTVPSSFPSAEEEKQRLYETAKAQREALWGVDSAAPSSRGFYPSAEEEKYRFAQAQAERDAFLRGQQRMSMSGPFSSSTSLRATIGKNGFPSAEEEKLLLYERAKAQVEETQRELHGTFAPSAHTTGVPAAIRYSAPGAFPSAEEERRLLYEQAKAEVEAIQLATTSNKPPQEAVRPVQGSTAADEKAQMQRYFEARDAVAKFQTQSTSTESVQGREPASPALRKPEPSYATGYAPAIRSADQNTPPKIPPKTTPSAVSGAFESFGNGSYFHASGKDKEADDSASVFSLPIRSASVVAGKQRSAPSPRSSPSPLPLPVFSFSSFSGAQPTGFIDQRMSQPQKARPLAVVPDVPRFGDASLYAPKIATMNWHEEEDDSEAGTRFQSSGATTRKALAPPLPPKIPLADRFQSAECAGSPAHIAVGPGESSLS